MLMEFLNSVSLSAVNEPRISDAPEGTKYPLPHVNSVGLAVPPMAAVSLPPFAEKPPEPVQRTSLLPVPRARVNVPTPLLSRTPPARTTLLAVGSPVPELARRTPAERVVAPL